MKTHKKKQKVIKETQFETYRIFNRNKIKNVIHRKILKKSQERVKKTQFEILRILIETKQKT